MSHFAVLVAVKDGEELEDILEPYNEQTEHQEYKEFHDMTDEVMDDWENKTMNGAYINGILTPAWDIKNDLVLEVQKYPMQLYYVDFETYVRDYAGFSAPLIINGEKRYGYWHNPNAKWDWWVIGGRWNGMLRNKDGRRVNEELVEQIDFEQMRQEQVDAELVKRSMIMELVELGHRTGDEVKKAIFDLGKSIEFYSFASLEPEYWMDEEMVRERAYSKPLTFAYLSSDSGWIQRGRMGWWGSVSDEVDEYPEQFWNAINSLSPDTYIYLVDCHI